MYHKFLFLIVFSILGYAFLMETQHLEAHKPFFPPSSPIKENALPINKPNISQVFYFVLSEDENEFWFKLNLEKGHSLILELWTNKFDIYKNMYPDLTLYFENEKLSTDWTKILLAKNYEDAKKIYQKYSKNLLGIIADIRFPKKIN